MWLAFLRRLSEFPLLVQSGRPDLKARRSIRRRGGYLYVAVLMTAAAVSAMGLAALSTAAMRLRSATAANDWSEAQVLAQSASEDAIRQINDDNNWRDRYVNGQQYPATPVSLGRGTYHWKFVDDDGNLQDDDSDSVRVVGIGRVGDAVATESVRLLPAGQALSSLESTLHCAGNITLGTGIRFATDQHLSTNANVTASGFGTAIDGNVEAVGTITGTINGTKSQGVAARRMPGSSVFDYYLDNGEWLSIGSLPMINGVATIEKTVLGSQANAYGSRVNPEGIYVIPCGGQRVIIRNCRIGGTLVLINPAATSLIEGSVRWEAAVGNYPALLVSGSIEFKTSSFNLDEAALGVNFNPPEAPYLGLTDNDMADTYPSEISGLVFVSGNMNLPIDFLESVFRGVVICNSISANSACRFHYRPLLLDYPAPGFSSGDPMLVSPSSRRRESLP